MFYHSCSISIIVNKHNYSCIWKKLPWLRKGTSIQVVGTWGIWETICLSGLILQLGHGGPERGRDFSMDAKIWEPRISDSHFFAVSITKYCGICWDLKQEIGKVTLLVKNALARAGDIRDVGSTPGSGGSLGEGHGKPFRYSCLRNPLDSGTWLSRLNLAHAMCCFVSFTCLYSLNPPHGLQPTRLFCPWNSPGKHAGVGSYFLLQGIFLTQGSNPGLPHCRQILYSLSHRGSPPKCLYYYNFYFRESEIEVHSNFITYPASWCC